MIDRRTWRDIRLLGVPVRQLADSAPFDYLGAEECRAIYIEFDTIPANLARQAGALRKRRPIIGKLPGKGWRRLLIRRAAARMSHRVATGSDVDEHIYFR